MAAAVIISIFGSLLGLIFGKKIEESQLSQKLFFENTSHELKTPLTSIRGYAEGMERGVITDYQKTGSVIISQTEKMSRLIDDILLMAKLESGLGLRSSIQMWRSANSFRTALCLLKEQ